MSKRKAPQLLADQNLSSHEIEKRSRIGEDEILQEQEETKELFLSENDLMKSKSNDKTLDSEIFNVRFEAAQKFLRKKEIESREAIFVSDYYERERRKRLENIKNSEPDNMFHGTTELSMND